MLSVIELTIAGGAVRVGTVLRFKGQAYECVGLKPHKTRKGQEVMLAEFESHCAECERPFRFFVAEGNRFSPNRRCQTHKRPGIPVGLPQRAKRLKAKGVKIISRGNLQEDYPF